MFGWILLVLFALAGAWFFFFRVEGRQQLNGKPNGSNKYHCVTIEHRKDACQAAIKLGGIRFLSRDAPTLPLPECNAAACHCRYAHYEDRRDDERRSPIGIQRELTTLGTDERRGGGDRRISIESRAAIRPQRILVSR